MKLALLQCAPQSDGVSVALRKLNDAAREAGGHAADILVTPEMYLTGYAIGAEAVRSAALTPDGPSLQEVSEIAKRWGVAILVGYPERGADGKVYNSIQLFDQKGATRTVYRKSHLWGDVDAEQFSRGEALSEIADIQGWKLGLAICYDIEFPELARSLAMAGADAILVSTASMKPYETVATQMIPVRAEENELCIAYCNYVGSERSIDYYGLSTVAGPDGKVVGQAKDQEMLLIAQLDRGKLDAWRENNTHIRDRRPDLYGALVG